MRIIDYSAAMRIVNVADLPRGSGAKYLEVLESHVEGELIAVAWRRKQPRSLPKGRALIRFGGKP